MVANSACELSSAVYDIALTRSSFLPALMAGDTTRIHGPC